MKKTENILGRLIGATWRSLRKQLIANVSQSNHNITAEQGIMLAMLTHYDNMNQQMFCEFLNCDKTAITRWLDVLESKNFVKRHADKIDRRQNILELTSEGEKTASEFIEIGKLTEKQALAGVCKKDADTCKKVLKQIISNLENRL